MAEKNEKIYEKAKISSRKVLAVKRTNKHIYSDLIDPETGNVIDSASDLEIKEGTKSQKAEKVGEKIAEVAKEHKIVKVVFDRRNYKYHGRVKALAESARKSGLEF